MNRLMTTALLAATSIFGACGATETRLPEGGATVGGLVIEAYQHSARNLSMNTGFSTTRFVEFRVLHQGRPISVPGNFGKPTPDVRDAWVLADAPRAAVLMGGQSWNLVVEENGRAQVVTLTPHDGDNSIQWLDTAGGPGPVLVSKLREDARDPRVLTGGRRLLVGRDVVLDVNTLEWRRLERELPAGYRPVTGDTVLWPATGGALVELFVGESNSAHDALLVASDPATGRSLRIPFDLATTGRRDFLPPDPAWLDAHFERVTTADGKAMLRQRTVPSRTPWQLRYQFGAAAPRGARQPLQRFTVSPVRPAMLQAVRELSSQIFKIVDEAPQAGDPPSASFMRVSTWMAPIVLRFDAQSQAVVIESEHPEYPVNAQSAVQQIGELVEAALVDGRLAAHLIRRQH